MAVVADSVLDQHIETLENILEAAKARNHAGEHAATRCAHSWSMLRALRLVLPELVELTKNGMVHQDLVDVVENAVALAEGRTNEVKSNKEIENATHQHPG